MSHQEYTVCVYEDHTEWRNKKGQYHRIDGPAIEYANGSKHWYQNGQYHRINGPAIENANGYKAWYLEGKELLEAAFNTEIARRNAAVATPCSLDGKLFTAEDGTKYKLSLVKE